jgi:hypothetical protein
MISRVRDPRIFKTLTVVTLLASVLLFQGCTSTNGIVQSEGNNANPVPQGSRQLGLDILYTTPSSSFHNNVTYAQFAGATYLILGLGWKEIETSTPGDCTTPGTYTDPGNALATLNSTLPSANMKLSLSIVPISTGLDLRPSNLKFLAFDNPLTICRYQMMLKFVFSIIPDVTLVSMQFGNEIDEFGSANQVSFWSQYWHFYVNVSPTAKSLRAGLKTSVIGTLYGAIGQSSNELAQGGLQQIYNSADMVSVTYYPLNHDFSVKTPSVVFTDIGALVELYPSKRIHFNEIGYQSDSTYDGSSQALQQDFIHTVFQTWDLYPTQITHMSFLRLNDLSLSNAQRAAAIYGLEGNNNFIAFLQTLGLRTYAGSDKAAFIQLKTETSSRGWSIHGQLPPRAKSRGVLRVDE